LSLSGHILYLRDDRVSKLITWYIRALQNAIDMIWDYIEWRSASKSLLEKVKSWS
jgi:hypothetical protein